MWNRLKQILASPVFEDEEKTRIAGILNVILFTIILLVGTLTIFRLISAGGDIDSSIVVNGILVLIAIVLQVLLRQGYVKTASLLLVSLSWIALTYQAWSADGIWDAAFIAYIVIILLANLLLGWQAGVIFVGLSILAGWGLAYAESTDIIEVKIDHPYSFALDLTVIFGLAAVVLALTTAGLSNALRRTRSKERRLMEFQALAENATDGIFMASPTGEITYANRAGYELLGRDYEQKEIDDLDFAALIPAAEEVEEVSHDTLLATLQAGSWQGELQQHRQDGTLVDIHSTAFAIEDEQTEEAVAVAAIIRDITQQKQAKNEREQLQQEVIEAQQQAIKELSTPVIPIMEQVIVMPLVGSIDTLRARDVTRSLLTGISEHQAKVVILDITGVSVVDTGVVNYLNKTIQAARLKGARTIVTGISDSVAETIVELGIDWSNIETLRDLQTGLLTALQSMGVKLSGVAKERGE